METYRDHIRYVWYINKQYEAVIPTITTYIDCGGWSTDVQGDSKLQTLGAGGTRGKEQVTVGKGNSWYE